MTSVTHRPDVRVSPRDLLLPGRLFSVEFRQAAQQLCGLGFEKLDRSQRSFGMPVGHATHLLRSSTAN